MRSGASANSMILLAWIENTRPADVNCLTTSSPTRAGSFFKVVDTFYALERAELIEDHPTDLQFAPQSSRCPIAVK